MTTAASIRDLKNQTTALLREVERGTLIRQVSSRVLFLRKYSIFF